MSGAKAKIKEIQKHLKAEEYDDVIELSKQVFKEEKTPTPNVYNALVFAGVAYSKLERYDESEKVYKRAIDLFPDLPLAYQGLQKLFTDREEWEKLALMLQDMTIKAVDNQNANDVAKHLQRLLEVREKQEMPKEIHRLLDLLLPSSPLYNLLNQLEPPDTSTATTDSGASSYTPWQIPSFPAPPSIHTLPLSQPLPSSSLTFSAPPKPPSPMPAIAQMIHHSDTSLALLLSLTLEQEHGERDREEKEVGIRRKRLGAGSESQVRRAVAREFLCESRMPEYYDEILAHPATPDDLRRAAESRLLRHWYRLMTCLSRNTPDDKAAGETDQTPFPQNLFDPPTRTTSVPSKESIRGKIEELIRGMVLLKVEDESAWATTLEWTDATSLGDYSLSFLHEYSLLFPSSPYTTLITGYLRYFELPGPNDETTEKIKAKRRERRKTKKDAGKKNKKDANAEDDVKEDEMSPEEALKTEENKRKEPYTVLINGIESLPKSLFGHKILAEAYLREADYANIIATAEKGKSLIKAMDIETGLKLQGSITFLDILLGTAFVHYYAPKHHPKALKLLDGVLADHPDSVPCFLGRGYVFAGEQRWHEARLEFEKAITLERESQDPTATPKEGQPTGSVWSAFRLEATEQQGWCMTKETMLAEGIEVLRGVAEVFDTDVARKTDSARVWWRIGVAEWEMGGEYRNSAFETFVKSLRHFDAFAPAFTAMGVWYLDQADPPDEDRASKCFQKAFELDATQAEAARRLAEGYAREEEWALVNVVAKRVMEGEGGIEGGLSGQEAGAAGKFTPTNAWAWKASGAVQMHYNKYELAAQAFQVALRSESEDPFIWARLGEAYAKAGKQVASLKALYHALQLAPDMWMCYYHIGNVHQQLGSYGQAISAYERILQHHPDEAGVILALSEAWLAMGKAECAIGLRERAYRSSVHCIERVASIIPTTQLYRRTTWKLFADACLNIVAAVSDEDDLSDALEAVLPILEHLADADTDKAADITGVASTASLIDSDRFGRREILKAGILAFTYRADLLKFDTKIAEIPLYDKACALHMLVLNLMAVDRNHQEIPAARNASLLAIKSALDFDPSSPSLWNAFAVFAAPASAELAQHAYSLSIRLEPKNSLVWSNYGYLCLAHNDHELANEAFNKAQVYDPENASAWLGQGLVAYRNDDFAEALSLFEQASTLSAGNLLPSGLGYAALLYAPTVSSGTEIDISLLHEPSFALGRYCDDQPYDTSALLLHALILEKLGLITPAIARVRQAVKVLESRYESAESAEVEKEYAVALVNLGRLQLAEGENAEAAATLTDCIGLCSDRTDDEGLAVLVQCHLVTALSLSNRSQADEALECFQKSLDMADRLSVPSKRDVCKERISVLLARTLWHTGSADAREAAKTNLLEAFSAEAHTTEAMITLATLGVLTSDDGIVEAVVAEIDELGIDQPDPRGELSYLRSLIKLAKDDGEGAKKVLARAVHINTSDVQSRLRLAKMSLSKNETSSALGLTNGLLELKQGLTVEETAEGLSLQSEAQRLKGNKEEGLRSAQRAIKLQPWEQRHWDAASSCLPSESSA